MVLEAFPNATILRPAPIYGAEDKLLLRYAAIIHHSDKIPLLTRAQRFQPVWVGDVAGAVASAVVDSNTKGKIYELGGPLTITDYSLAGVMCEAMYDKDLRVQMSDEQFKKMLKWKQFSIPWRRWYPADLYDQMQCDLLVNSDALTFKDLGITPSTLNDHFQHVVRVRDQFLQSTSTEVNVFEKF